MKTTLPILSEVVDITSDMAYDGNFITNHIWDYNDFLKQPLKLEMFIPCKDGVPLEEPKYGMSGYNYKYKYLEYQQAKERVIFKGFTHEIIDNYLHLKTKTFHIVYNLRDNNFVAFKSISDLCNRVELTESEHKRLGL